MTTAAGATTSSPPATTGRRSGTRGRGRKQHTLLRLRGDIPFSARVAIAVGGVLALIGLWWLAADVLVNEVFLPNPADTIDGLQRYWASGDLGTDLQASTVRIAEGYAISMAVGIVLGVLIGSYRSVEAFWESPIGFLRYIPATALTPLFLVAFGLEDDSKVALVVAGTVFFNVVMIADVARAVPREMIDTAYTLGAGRLRVLGRVVMPHCLPGIIDVGRVNLAAAWPMLVVAELFAASEGLAYRLNFLRRGSDWSGMFAILLIFGIIGLVSDLLLRLLRNRVSPWAAIVTAPVVQGTDPVTAPLGRRGAPKLVVRDVVKDFRPSRTATVRAIDGITFDVADQELVCLVGSSGCGKSTLLNIVAGLEQPTSGSVEVDGERVVGPGPDRGMVFQTYSLYPWRTVAENVAFGLECTGMRKRARDERVSELLGIVGLTKFADHTPNQLSGGMRQRVAIARALAPEPDVLLLDEPFGALDAQTRRSMQDFLLTLWRRTRATVLFVTHDIGEAIYLGSRVIVLASHPGRVLDEIDVPFGPGHGPEITRDRRYLDLRDEIEDLLGTP